MNVQYSGLIILYDIITDKVMIAEYRNMNY